MYFFKRSFVLTLIWIIFFSTPVLGTEEHFPIDLRTENGEVIDIIGGKNINEPYSPKETCGKCHNYNSIIRGQHFHLDKITKENIMEYWWYPLYYRHLTGEDISRKEQLDLTKFQFVKILGKYHPGGAGLEHDSEGKRYDEVLSKDLEFKDILDGEYFKSRWDKSGVLEADCMICHLNGYDYTSRRDQLEWENFRWAATAGSRLGNVSEKVSLGETPKITYDFEKFNSEGKVKLDMKKAPSQNCLNCHGKLGQVKTGFSWGDEKNTDVHNLGGMECVDCHPLIDTEETPAIYHQISKGQSCRSCHESGTQNSLAYSHQNVKESHLEYISCEACHIPYKNRVAAGAVDVTTGKISLLANGEDTEINKVTRWYPDLIRDKEGKIYPVNTVHGVWWGNKISESKIVPLYLKEIKPAYEKIKEQITDDNKDGIPEANRKKEIVAMLRSLKETLKNNKRFENINPVFAKGNRIYKLDSSNRLIATKKENLTGKSYYIAHNVAPAKKALGNGGCSECHSSESRWVAAGIMQDPFGPEGEPIEVTQGSILGLSPSLMGIHGMYLVNYDRGLLIAVAGIIVTALLHYLIIGPNEKELGKMPRNIQRYSALERWSHNIRMFSTILLMLTGAGFVLYTTGLVNLFGGYYATRYIHIFLGVLFAISSLVATVIWFKDSLFKSYDIAWLKDMGGYLTKEKKHPPAGRFNAGQKLFYWVSTLLSIILIITGVMLIYRDIYSGGFLLGIVVTHGASALILIAGVIAHAYLGTFANPGTWNVLVDGKVSEEWAKVHHPKWDPK